MVCSSILERPEPVIGFCFSFPVEQASVNSGKLLRWTKGYTNPGAVGQDPAKLLAEAFRRKVTTNGLSCLNGVRHRRTLCRWVMQLCASHSCNSMPLSTGWWKASRVE